MSKKISNIVHTIWLEKSLLSPRLIELFEIFESFFDIPKLIFTQLRFFSLRVKKIILLPSMASETMLFIHLVLLC